MRKVITQLFQLEMWFIAFKVVQIPKPLLHLYDILSFNFTLKHYDFPKYIQTYVYKFKQIHKEIQSINLNIHSSLKY